MTPLSPLFLLPLLALCSATAQLNGAATHRNDAATHLDPADTNDNDAVTNHADTKPDITGDGNGSACPNTASPEVGNSTKHCLCCGANRIGVAVRGRVEELEGRLRNRRTELHREVELALSIAHEDILASFNTSYPHFAPTIAPLLVRLFKSLEEGVRGKGTTAPLIDTLLDQFWDDLFPIVYHSAIHTDLPPLAATYVTCLRAARPEINPFGVVPRLVGPPLGRFLGAGRLLQGGLEAAEEAVAAARSQTGRMKDSCIAASSRMLCPSCQPAPPSPPCPALCLNVARGCLAPLAPLGPAWADLLNGVAKAARGLRGAQGGLELLPEHLPDAVLVAMETGHQLAKKVRRKCGLLPHAEKTSTTAGISTSPTTDTPPLPAPKEHRHWQGDTVLGELLKELSEARSWWQDLPDGVCGPLTKGTEEGGCWTGEGLGSYPHPVVGPSPGAQRYNPEVVVERGHQRWGRQLGERLLGVSRLIQSGINWLPETTSHSKETRLSGELPQDEPYRVARDSVPHEGTYDVPGEGVSQDSPYGHPREGGAPGDPYNAPYDPYGTPDQHGYDHYGQPKPRHPDQGSGVWVDHDDEDGFDAGSGYSGDGNIVDDSHLTTILGNRPPLTTTDKGAAGQLGCPMAGVVVVLAVVAAKWQLML